MVTKHCRQTRWPHDYFFATRQDQISIGGLESNVVKTGALCIQYTKVESQVTVPTPPPLLCAEVQVRFFIEYRIDQWQSE